LHQIEQEDFHLLSEKIEIQRNQIPLTFNRKTTLNMKPSTLSLFLACFSVCTFFARAQTMQSGLISVAPGSSVANYYYARPGDLTIVVNIWGFVQKPGRYEVSSTTDLVQLIALAGGPAEYADMSAVRITRLPETGGDQKKRQLTVNLEDLTRLTDQELVLKPGDTIVVDSSGWFTFRDVLSGVTGVAVLVVAVVQIINLTK